MFKARIHRFVIRHCMGWCLAGVLLSVLQPFLFNHFRQDACVMATVAFVLLCKPTLRPVGAVLLALAVATGWARIYVGVHFPFDIVAGFALAVVIAGVCVAAIRSFRWAKTSSAVGHPASIVHGEQS